MFTLWGVQAGDNEKLYFSSLTNICSLISLLTKKISLKSLSILGTFVNGGGQRS